MDALKLLVRVLRDMSLGILFVLLFCLYIAGVPAYFIANIFKPRRGEKL